MDSREPGLGSEIVSERVPWVSGLGSEIVSVRYMRHLLDLLIFYVNEI